MNTSRCPASCVSRCGGHWLYVKAIRQSLALSEAEFYALPKRLPIKPKAVLVITSHIETKHFTVSTPECLPMLYDQSNFPSYTHQMQYLVPALPAPAARCRDLEQRHGRRTADVKQVGLASRTVEFKNILQYK